MSQGTVLALVLAIGLLPFVFVLVLAEAAISTTSPIRVATLHDEQPKRVERLLRLLEAPESLLNPLRLIILAGQLAQIVLVSVVASEYLDPGYVVLVVFLGVLVAYVVEVSGRTLGLLHADRLAVALSGPTALIAMLPPVRLLARTLIGAGNIVIPGKGLSTGPFSLPAEFIAFADAAVEDDVLEPVERDLIESVITFGDTVVREVMVPRTDMTTVDRHRTVAEALELSSDVGYSRLPVEGDNIDDLIGLVYVKDLIRAELDDGDDRRVDSLLRQARFVPETKQVAHLLREMQEESFHMAIVVDEYGGVAGLVTLEDLIEELVGEIVDEYDVEEPLVERQRDGSLRVDGRILISELNDIAGLSLPEGDFDTVAGLVFDRFGRVPTEGEQTDADGYVLKVERVQARRITRVHVTAPPREQPDEDHQ
jgi:CBS domain containing-hemolysin-like protein